MFVNKFLYVSMIFVFAKTVVRAQHSCVPFKLKKEYLNKRLVGYSLFETKVSHHQMCAYFCMFFGVCESINFAKKERMCELNSEGSETTNSVDFIEDSGTIYSDITDWPKKIASGCHNHNCADHQRCWPFGNDAFKCVDITCDEPPNVENALVEPGSCLAGSVRAYTFTCPEARYPVGNTKIKCLHNGSWTDLEARCKRLQACAHLKECNPSYTDGEYWLNPELFGDEKLKVYCHQMNSSSPEEFITLNSETNYGHSSGSLEGNYIRSTTHYGKIRLDLTTMVIQTYRFDFTDNQPDGSLLSYGYAFGCQCICTDGYFKIDSRGTGLKFGSSIEWTYNTDLGRMADFSRNAASTVISASCGGRCGSCYPASALYVELDQTQYIPDEDATFPVCVSQ